MIRGENLQMARNDEIKLYMLVLLEKGYIYILSVSFFFNVSNNLKIKSLEHGDSIPVTGI